MSAVDVVQGDALDDWLFKAPNDGEAAAALQLDRHGVAHLSQGRFDFAEFDRGAARVGARYEAAE